MQSKSAPDRTITIPAMYVDQPDAVLELESPDGGRGNITLRVAGEIVARGEGFGAPVIGLSLLEQSDESLASMFGAFLDHALTSSEDGARDGWPVLTDAASDWTDALALFGDES